VEHVGHLVVSRKRVDFDVSVFRDWSGQWHGCLNVHNAAASKMPLMRYRASSTRTVQFEEGEIFGDQGALLLPEIVETDFLA
jgi:hypothetical protein